MTINEIAKEIHENAVAHGWWDEDRGFPEIVALCHSELSEALEEYRNNRSLEYRRCPYDFDVCCTDTTNCERLRNCGGAEKFLFNKPEGIAVEMIDCMIRILDWCAKEGVDVEAVLKAKHEYNKTRPYKHGGKRC